jgi:hypothetical protein
MTRILSALVLLPLVLGIIWFLPPVGTFVLAEVALVLAFVEYAALAARLGAAFPRVVPGAAAMACCAAVGWWGVAADAVLLAAFIAVAATAVGAGRAGPEGPRCSRRSTWACRSAPSPPCARSRAAKPFCC